MKPKTLNIALALIAVTFAVVALRQRAAIESLQQQLDQAPAAVETAPVPSDQAPPADIASSLASAKTPSDAAEPDPAPATATQAEPPSSPSAAPRAMRDFSEMMMENPQMNEMMQASQRATLEVLYKDFLDNLQLSAEERDHLMDLLMARQMFRVETSMKLMGGNADPEESSLLAAEMKEYDQQVKAEIDFFLNNPTDSKAFEFYEDTMQERMSLAGFKNALAQSGDTLARDRERALIELMVEKRNAFPFTSDLHQQDNYDLSGDRFSEANLDAFEQDLSALHAQIAEEAASLMAPEQLAALEQSLQSMRRMQLSQLRMAANMFRQRQPDP